MLQALRGRPLPIEGASNVLKRGRSKFWPMKLLTASGPVSNFMGQNFDRPLLNTQFDSPLIRGPALHASKHCGGGPLLKGLLGCVLKRGRSKFWCPFLLTASGPVSNFMGQNFDRPLFNTQFEYPLSIGPDLRNCLKIAGEVPYSRGY